MLPSSRCTRVWQLKIVSVPSLHPIATVLDSGCHAAAVAAWPRRTCKPASCWPSSSKNSTELPRATARAPSTEDHVSVGSSAPLEPRTESGSSRKIEGINRPPLRAFN